MSTRYDILRANERYAESYDLAGLTAEPRRALAVLTCMDARLDPLRFLGLEPGDAHVLRNAGAEITEDVVRSLALSHGAGTSEVYVVAHENCLARAAAGGPDAETAARLAVQRLRDSGVALQPAGFVYDEQTGRIRAVA